MSHEQYSLEAKGTAAVGREDGDAMRSWTEQRLSASTTAAHIALGPLQVAGTKGFLTHLRIKGKINSCRGCWGGLPRDR